MVFFSPFGLFNIKFVLTLINNSVPCLEDQDPPLDDYKVQLRVEIKSYQNKKMHTE